MTRRQDTPVDPVVVKRLRGPVHFPAPPTPTHEADMGHPAHVLGRECSADEIEAYARAVGEPAWDLVLPIRLSPTPGRWLRVRYRRRAPADAPWSPDELRAELDLCGGDWQAVAAALGVPYRELRRWLDHESLAVLAPLWARERARIAERDRERGGARPESPLPRDPDTLRELLRRSGAPTAPGLLAAIRLLELYVDAVEEGREVPEGIREYLRRAGWIG